MSEAKSELELLKEKLFYDRKNAAEVCDAAEIQAADTDRKSVV